MTEAGAKHCPSRPRSSGEAAVASTRIDAPHPVRSAPSPGADSAGRSESEVVEAAAGRPGAWTAAQLDLQARELAERLQKQRRELERREARLHAQLAALDAQWRTSRLWIREKELQLRERQRRLERWEQRLEAQARTLVQGGAPGPTREAAAPGTLER